MKKKLFIIAGEKSGDLLGSKILQNINKDIFDIYGIGGELMLKNGLKESLFPMEELSLMGVFEILPKIFNLLKRIKQTADYIIKLQPDVVLTIDSPDFCFRVMKLVKKLDKENKIKKVHFIAPSVWAYREKRAEKISKIYDLLFCILPFEPPYFEKYGLKTIFVGHPLYDTTKYDNIQNNTENNTENNNIISITLGSRKGEVNRFYPIIIDVIKKLNRQDIKYYFLATNYTYDLIINKLKQDNIQNIEVIKENKNDIIKKSILVISKSGTNTLENAALAVPMVVFYKFGFLTNIIAKRIRKKSKVKFATIINIMNNKEIIPECLLEDCNSNNIYNKVNNLLNNPDLRKEQVENNLKTISILGYKSNNNSGNIIAKKIEELCD